MRIDTPKRFLKSLFGGSGLAQPQAAVISAMAVRDLRTCAEALGGAVFHYLDKSGLECDAIVRLENGSYGLVEIKTGGDALIEKGVKTLDSLSAKIDTTRMPSPSFRMVLVANGDFAYRRKEDGIVVCPIGCLRP